MTTTTPHAPAPDTSPAAIAARRRERAYALQDAARALKAEMVKPMEAAERLGIDKRMYEAHANASWRRQRIREVLEAGKAVAPDLTKPETALLEALLKVDMRMMLESATRSPESKYVSWEARKSNGWATTTARKRLDVREHAMATPAEEPSLGLVRVAGNGYISLTDEGWRVCAALWPERIVL
jgi:hypothetical protein